MRMRAHIVAALVGKDFSRLVRNGPALMLLGLFVLVAILVGSSGLVEEKKQSNSATAPLQETWIVYSEDSQWIQLLKRRAPDELGIRFRKISQLESETYPANICVIEIRPEKYFSDRKQIRRPIHYRYSGSDPQILWGVTRWFLSVSLEHFGEMPQFFETIQPIAPPTQEDQSRSALEDVSVADLLSLSLITTGLITTIQFFAACGLLVSLTAQERKRGALRALLLTPATFFEYVATKAVVHGGLALGTSTIAVAALQPAALNSLLLWGTMISVTCGYFAVGLLIACFAKNQAAPNLLSFAYVLAIGTLNLLAYRFEAFQFLSALTFERYGLILTIASLSAGDLSLAESLNAMRIPEFRRLVLLSSGLLLTALLVGLRRLRE